MVISRQEVARIISVRRRSGSVLPGGLSELLGMAAANLVQQIQALTTVHGASEHSIEPAVEVPDSFLSSQPKGKSWSWAAGSDCGESRR